jgi:hypothetical protein
VLAAIQPAALLLFEECAEVLEDRNQFNYSRSTAERRAGRGAVRA